MHSNPKGELIQMKYGSKITGDKQDSGENVLSFFAFLSCYCDKMFSIKYLVDSV